METSENNVYQAIVGVLGDLSKVGISKDNQNKQQGFSFRGIDDIYNELSKLLAKHKLCMLPRCLSREVTERKTAKGGAIFVVVVDVEYDLVCAVDGSKHTVRVPGEAMDTADKATNKAMSAAYKYACLQVFCIPTEGDNDADSTTHSVDPNERIESKLPHWTQEADKVETADERRKWYFRHEKKLAAELTKQEVVNLQSYLAQLKAGEEKQAEVKQ